ncbi:MAG: hypothetical protein D6735_06675 [Acidobacteria bacterium]|nr:MAG: hypothetical protein D6735_06675 [Acidobacteriota bacterium]
MNRSIIRIVIIVLAAIFAALAFVLNISLSTVLRESPIELAVYNVEKSAGEFLTEDDVSIATASGMPRQLLELYVTIPELEQYVGYKLIDNVKRGEPLMKSKLSKDFASRYSVFLTDTTKVIMNIPIREGMSPSVIEPGDRVNLISVIGNPSGRFPDPYPPTPTPFGTPPTSPSTQEGNGDAEAVQTPTPTPVVEFPVASVMVENALVVDSRYEIIREGDQVRRGALKSITILVPFNMQLPVALAMEMQTLKISMGGPMNSVGFPFRVLDYQELGRWIRYQIDEAAKRGDYISYTIYPEYIETFYPDVALSIKATRQAFVDSGDKNKQNYEYFKNRVLMVTPTPTPNQ